MKFKYLLNILSKLSKIQKSILPNSIFLIDKYYKILKYYKKYINKRLTTIKVYIPIIKLLKSNNLKTTKENRTRLQLKSHVVHISSIICTAGGTKASATLLQLACLPQTTHKSSLSHPHTCAHTDL